MVYRLLFVYNSEKYINRCLQSLCCLRGIEKCEIIIVNDGSTDNSESFILNFKSKLKFIYIKHEKNRGILECHRSGVNAASKEFVCFLDGDDELDRDFYSVTAYCEKIFNIDLICCRWSYSKKTLTKESRINGYLLDSPDEVDYCFRNDDYKKNIHIGLNRKILRTDILKSVYSEIEEIRLCSWEDLLVQSLVNKRSKRCLIIDCPLYIWYQNSDSISNIKLSNDFIFDTFFVLNRIRNIQDNQLFEKIYKVVIHDFIEHNLYITANSKDTFLNFCNELDKLSLNIKLFRWTRIILGESIIKKADLEKNNDILFIDNSNLKLIKSYFLSFFKANSCFKFKYSSFSDSDSILEYVKRIVLGIESKLIVTTAGFYGPDFMTSTPVIQLWHGMSVLKKVNPIYLPLVKSPCKSICSSEYVRKFYSKLFNCKLENVLPYGGILGNYIVQNKIHGRTDNKLLKYLWCPTFRKIKGNYLSDLTFEHLANIDILLNNNEQLTVRVHQASKDDYSQIKNNKYKHIRFSTNDDILDDLTETNVFVTDYSSSHCYAVLMDIPCVFWAYDYNKYIKNNGLLINYLNDLPGYKCLDDSCEEFVFLLRKSLNKTFENTESRKKYINNFLSGCTNSSNSKIIELIAGELENLK